MSLQEIFVLYVKFFFIYTPFFIVAVFLTITEDESYRTRNSLALRFSIGIVTISLIMFSFGQSIFAMLGITLEAFKVGAGALLFLTAVNLVDGKIQLPNTKTSVLDMAIVPLAIPFALGPGSIGMLIVADMEAIDPTHKIYIGITIAFASLSVGLMLFLATKIERLLGKSGIVMLSKLTGLILAALSCQMIFTGIATFFK